MLFFMQRFHFLLSFFLLAFIAGSCDNTFSPKAEYKERIVVFAVLDKSAAFQIVRLESTYDAEGATPETPINQREITEATVRIHAPLKVYSLKDTLVDDNLGGQKKIWITRDLLPEEGRTYTLEVIVPGVDPITAKVQVPGNPFLQVRPPFAQNGQGLVLAAGAISTIAPPKGFYFRVWVVGTKDVGGQLVEVRREVPTNVDPKTGAFVYSKPTRASAVSFQIDMLARVKSDLEIQEGASNFQIVADAYSMDTYLYGYFQTVRGFDDPVSVRQDRPDVSNVVGGVGVFGAIVPDSIRQSYSSIFTSK